MKIASYVWLFLLIITGANVQAQEPETLADAQNLAASRGRPILMEFLRSG